MDLCWDSPEAKALNEKIARVMYYHGMDENVSMAEELGSYETFPGSPASKGLFQFDLWNLEKLDKMKFGILEDVNYSQLIDIAGKILCYKNGDKIDLSTIGDDEIQKKAYLIQAVISQLKEVFGGVPCDELDWETLRDRMVRFGLYFSLLFAQMPTASSAQILGNNESIECYTQLLYARTVLSGQFAIVISYLVKDLEAIDMWNNDILKYLLTTQGSIQGFPLEDVPLVHQQRFIYLQKKYRTAFELSQKVIANLYLDRAKYQCQASSNNVFMKAPTLKSLNAYHFYMWKGGAKTGMYYLRQMTKSNPLNFALSDIRMATVQKESPSQESNGEEEGECLMCGS
jgi:ribonucleoside-diphosphate reductase alpha chain